MDEIIHHLAVLFQGYGKSISLGKAIREQQAVFFIKYLRTLGFSATNDIFCGKCVVFLEMHLSVQIIRICKKIFTKLQNILKCSLEIYF